MGDIVKVSCTRCGRHLGDYPNGAVKHVRCPNCDGDDPRDAALSRLRDEVERLTRERDIEREKFETETVLCQQAEERAASAERERDEEHRCWLVADGLVNEHLAAQREAERALTASRATIGNLCSVGATLAEFVIRRPPYAEFMHDGPKQTALAMLSAIRAATEPAPAPEPPPAPALPECPHEGMTGHCRGKVCSELSIMWMQRLNGCPDNVPARDGGKP